LIEHSNLKEEKVSRSDKFIAICAFVVLLIVAVIVLIDAVGGLITPGLSFANYVICFLGVVFMIFGVVGCVMGIWWISTNKIGGQ
jgi:hypothetical protein